MRFDLSSSSRLGKKAATTLFAASVILLATGQTYAHEFKLGQLVIVHPWARATPPGAKVAGGYLTIENNGTENDRLVAATAEIAGRVDVHEMAVDNGVMKMRPLTDGLEIPAGGSVELKPGSYHMMMMDLTGPLKAGESIAGTLTFEKAGTVDVTYVVGPIGSSDAPEEGNDMSGMGGDMGHGDMGGDMGGNDMGDKGAMDSMGQ